MYEYYLLLYEYYVLMYEYYVLMYEYYKEYSINTHFLCKLSEHIMRPAVCQPPTHAQKS